MNILVIGGAGFIGSNLIKTLSEQKHKITCIDNYSAGKTSNHVKGVNYIKECSSNLEKIEHLLLDIELVYHLGEYSRIAPSFDEIDRVWNYNIIGTFKILEFCRKNSLKIIYAGSSTKFASEGISHSPYSFSKAQNIELIKAYSKWYGLKYSICYFYNVFGPGHDSAPVKGYESVISIFENQYKTDNPLTITGDGNQERMFTYVGDVVEGLIKSSTVEKNGEYQLANTKIYTILEVAKMFSNNLIFLPPRKGDRKTSLAPDINETKSTLKWKPTLNVDDWVKQIKNS